MEASGKATFILHSVRTHVVNCAHSEAVTLCKIPHLSNFFQITGLSSIWQLNLIFKQGRMIPHGYCNRNSI